MFYQSRRSIPWPVKALIACTAVILTGVLSAGYASAGPAPGTKLATLKAGGATRDFGSAVALSGTTAVVGQPSESGFTIPGRVFVFTKTTTGWKQTATLEASDHAAEDQFGSAVAVSGNTIAVGDPNPSNGRHCGGFSCGAVYIFTKTTTGWKQAAEFKDPNPVSSNYGNDLFGHAVATTGNTVYAGSPGYDQSPSTTGNGGAVFAYTQTTSGWQQTAKITPSSSAGLGLGWSLAVSGSTVVAGAFSCQTCASSAAYVLTHTTSGWTQDRLTSSDFTSGDGFGESVSVSGSVIAVGAPYHANFSGRVYVFAKTTTGWKQTAELSHGSPILEFGLSAGISGTALVVSNVGAAGPVYFFAKTTTGWKYVTTVNLTGGVTGVSVSGSLALAAAQPGTSAGRGDIFEA